MSRWGPPLDARPAHVRTRAALLDLLAALSPAEWAAVTAAAPWTVRDVAAHLLGDDVSRLSRTRDGWTVPLEGDFPASLHRANQRWVEAHAGVSPAALLELLRASSASVEALWASLDLDDTGEPVSWADPGPAPVWLDCARDFSEDWVHQAQVRLATGRSASDDHDATVTVLETFARAVPLTLERQDAPPGRLRLAVPDADLTWSWEHAGGWGWADDDAAAPDASVTVPAEVLWRTAVRMTEPEEAVARAEIAGDQVLGRAALHLVSIIR